MALIILDLAGPALRGRPSVFMASQARCDEPCGLPYLLDGLVEVWQPGMSTGRKMPPGIVLLRKQVLLLICQASFKMSPVLAH